MMIHLNTNANQFMLYDLSIWLWLVLAAAIIAAFAQQHIATIGLLISALIAAIYYDRLTLITAGAVAVVFVIAWLIRQHPHRYKPFAVFFLVVWNIALFLHQIPGFDNLQVLNNALSGPQSQPFSMYLNLDKPLAFFTLLLAYPALLGNARTSNKPAIIAILLALFSLLPIAAMLGALKYEFSIPTWWWLFALNNLLLTCIAEEALFRGYIQQQLTHKLGVWAGLMIASALFGLAHFSGGVLLMLFATLAGIGYGLIFHLSGRLWAAVLAHFAFNFLHLIVFTYPILKS
ncbi:caax amino protease family protein [Vibrio sp. N418]|nr:caax amino protease family protein [Vibrio sp. N418]